MKKLSDISNIKDILTRHGFTFSKSLGQNFLINPGVCPRMAEECGAGDGCGVIEIGPGIGVLTYELAKRAEKVVAIELDSRLMPVLEETLEEFDNVKVINADVLKIDLHKLIQEEFPGMNVAICANLPYYITSPIIMKLLEDRLPVKSITVMVQKEAAQRICALPGSREVGAVSLAVRYYAEPEILFKVAAGSFMPAPKVDSAVIRLNIRQEKCVDVKDEKILFAVIKAAFAQRRKTILNCISTGFSIEKSVLTELLDKAGVKPNDRAEQLSMSEFSAIADRIYEYKNKEGTQ